jgi:hypothetical protein
MTTPTPEWSVEYLPYTLTDADGTERELPNYRIAPYDEPELYIAETNEDLPDEVQAAHATLMSAAPQLLDALEYFFNIMHDFKSSFEKGYVEDAMKQARIAIARAHGRSGT